MEAVINGNKLELMQGDITKQATDAIVNAANGSLLGGGGVDGAIHRAAGPKLLAACKQVREEMNGAYLPTAEAVMTKGYHLPAKFVIHTVGPIWDSDAPNKEKLLANCYQNSLRLAQKHGLTSISFPSISTGVYRFPVDLASRIAMETIVDFLENNKFGTVIMTLFSEADYKSYAASLAAVLQK